MDCTAESHYWHLRLLPIATIATETGEELDSITAQVVLFSVHVMFSNIEIITYASICVSTRYIRPVELLKIEFPRTVINYIANNYPQ